MVKSLFLLLIFFVVGCSQKSAPDTSSTPVEETTAETMSIQAISDQSIAEGSILDVGTVSCTTSGGSSATYYAVQQESNSLSNCSVNSSTQNLSCNVSYLGGHTAWTSLVTVFCSKDTVSTTTTFTISISDTNRAPVLDAISNQDAVEENAIVAVDPGDGSDDIDVDLDTITYTCTFEGGSFPAGTDCASQLPSDSVSFTTSTGVLTWTPSTAATTTASTAYTFTITGSDGQTPALTDTETFVITVYQSGTNLPPVIGSNQSLVVNEDSGGNNFTVNSATDANGDTIVYTVVTAPTKGVLSNCMGGSTDLSCTYTPNSNVNGSDSIVYKATDTGPLDSQSNATISITISPVNDAPSISGSSGTTNYTENDGAVVIYNGMGASDIDDTNIESATVSITANHSSTDDALGFTNQNNIVGSYNSSTGVLTLTGSDSLANYATAINSVTYTNSSEDPNPGATPNPNSRTITYVINDGDTDSNSFTYTVQISEANDAPVITGTTGTMNYTENATTVVYSGFTLSDPDNTNLASATITITNHKGAEDLLTYTNPGGLSGSYNNSTGVLAITGSVTLANYQTVLQGLKYENSSDTPDTTTRTLTFVINDGSTNSNTFNYSIALTAVNDAPTITGGPNAQVFPIDGTDEPVLQEATYSIAASASDAESDSITFACTVESIDLNASDPNYVASSTNCTSLTSYVTTNSVVYEGSSTFNTTSTTGTFTWVPTNTVRGTYKVIIQATSSGTGTPSSTKDYYLSVRPGETTTNLVAGHEGTFSTHKSSVATLTNIASIPRSSASDLDAWLDIKGSTNGTLNNFTSPWSGTGQVGTSLSPYQITYDGVDDNIDLGTPLSSQTHHVINTWINLNSIAASEQGAVIAGNGGGGANGFVLRQDPSNAAKLNITMGTSGGCTGNLTFATNQWNFISSLHDGTNLKLYVNGVEDCTTALAWSNGSTNFFLGAQNGGTNAWNGSMGSFKIYAKNGSSAGTSTDIVNSFQKTANQYRIVPIGNITTDSLILHADAANANRGLQNYSDGCAAADLTWYGSFASGLTGTLDNFSSCGSATGWYKDGTSPNPYTLVFDGGNNANGDEVRFTITDGLLTDNTALSFSFWAKSSDIQNGFRLGGIGSASTDLFGIRFGGNSTSGDLSSYSLCLYNGSDYDCSDTNTLTTGMENTWMHVVITYKQNATGRNTKHYINGTLLTYNSEGGETEINDSIGTHTIISLGEYPKATGDRFKGSIGSFSVYNKELSVAEIKQNCLADAARYTATPSSFCATP